MRVLKDLVFFNFAAACFLSVPLLLLKIFFRATLAPLIENCSNCSLLHKNFFNTAGISSSLIDFTASLSLLTLSLASVTSSSSSSLSSSESPSSAPSSASPSIPSPASSNQHPCRLLQPFPKLMYLLNMELAL